jgi:diguanylate cyclase (GGDEF)-like protein/PAS domain S-box-containing protein
MTPSHLDRRPRVLVVDDEELIRMMSREALEVAGFAVVEAADGAEALSLIGEQRPDIVLLDIKMPVMDGFETCREIRKTEAGRHMPILVMTGLDDVDSIERAYQVGATDFVIKPINWVILGHRVDYMLRAGRSAQELRDSRAHLANAQRIARLGYWEWIRATNEFVCSFELERILGMEPGESIATLNRYLEAVHPHDRVFVQNAIEELLLEDVPLDIEYRVLRRDGGVRFVQQQGERVLDDRDRAIRITGTVQDVSERKHAEEKIRFLAYYDRLTSLPNRRSFAERLNLALANAQRHDRLVATLLLGLDRFKRVNDTLGHRAGDHLLQQVADRLLGCVRCTDVIGRPGAGDVVARFAGDEFAVLLTEISDPRDAVTVATRLADSLKEPFTLNGQTVFLTASTGISVFPEDGSEGEDLTKNAEAAMYHAKEEGGDGYRYYSSAMNASTAERLTMETELRQALERGEFLLHYQPLFDANSGRVVGAEALIRWRHPEKGLLSPMTFIPVAEESGLIVPIGEWVMRSACEQAKEWESCGYGSVRVSVNLSSRQVDREALPLTVRGALEAADLAADRLQIELTESTLMEDAEGASDCLQALKELGVGLLIDDFGTGYSSLSYLMRFPLDGIKIDRSFLEGVPEAEEQVAITNAIIAMAQSLRLDLIAEGVETQSQESFLREKGCEVLQGFLLSRPLPAEDFSRLLEQLALQPELVAKAG